MRPGKKKPKPNRQHKVRGQEEIKEAYRYYKNLLSSPTSNNKYEVIFNIFPGKSVKQKNNELTRAVEENEVVVVVWDFHPDKALGLEGSLSHSIKTTGSLSKKI